MVEESFRVGRGIEDKASMCSYCAVVVMKSFIYWEFEIMGVSSTHVEAPDTSPLSPDAAAFKTRLYSSICLSLLFPRR